MDDTGLGSGFAIRAGNNGIATAFNGEDRHATVVSGGSSARDRKRHREPVRQNKE
jgi:hypothetical protein